MPIPRPTATVGSTALEGAQRVRIGSRGDRKVQDAPGASYPISRSDEPEGGEPPLAWLRKVPKGTWMQYYPGIRLKGIL